MTRFSLVVLLTMLVSVSADVRDWTVNRNVTRGGSTSYTLDVAYLISVNSVKLYVNYANSTSCTKNFNFQGRAMQRSCVGNSCTFSSDVGTINPLLAFSNAGTCVANVKTGSVWFSTYSTYDFPDQVTLSTGSNHYYDYPASLLVDYIFEFRVTLQSSCALNPQIQLIGDHSKFTIACTATTCTIGFNRNIVARTKPKRKNSIQVRNNGHCAVTLTNPSMIYAVDLSKVLAALAAWAIALIVVGALCCAFCVVLGLCFRRRRMTTSTVIIQDQYPIVQAAQPQYGGQQSRYVQHQ